MMLPIKQDTIHYNLLILITYQPIKGYFMPRC